MSKARLFLVHDTTGTLINQILALLDSAIVDHDHVRIEAYTAAIRNLFESANSGLEGI